MNTDYPYAQPARQYSGEKPRILLVAAPAWREGMEAIQAEIAGADIILVPDEMAEIQKAVPGVNAMIGCPRFMFNDELMRHAGNELTWVHVPGAGVEQFMIPLFVESGVTLTNGRVIQGPEVADHALALMLALTRNLHLILTGKTDQPMPRPIELYGKTAIVLGLGGIGMLVAERCRGFGMRVIGVDADYTPMSNALEFAVRPDRLREVLSQGDFVIMTAPHGVFSNPMLDRPEFDAMKQGAYFINVSRGRTVSTDALTEALFSGQLAGAGLDVTDPEPLPDDHPLRNMDHVVLTPHIAGLSEHNRQRSFDLIRENVQRFIKHQPLLNIVDKAVGY